jgi:hypothetical protein
VGDGCCCEEELDEVDESTVVRLCTFAQASAVIRITGQPRPNKVSSETRRACCFDVGRALERAVPRTSHANQSVFAALVISDSRITQSTYKIKRLPSSTTISPSKTFHQQTSPYTSHRLSSAFSSITNTQLHVKSTTSFKMTGGKSGGKASGAKNAQS